MHSKELQGVLSYLLGVIEPERVGVSYSLQLQFPEPLLKSTTETQPLLCWPERDWEIQIDGIRWQEEERNMVIERMSWEKEGKRQKILGKHSEGHKRTGERMERERKRER